MSDKLDLIKDTTQNFCALDPETKKFVLGYITGKLEERASWEQQQDNKKPA